jgi:glycerol-3-phosphate dehydrogenase
MMGSAASRRERRPKGMSPTNERLVTGDFDVVVIGAGVLGCAVAARLAQAELRLCVLEATDDIAEGASKGNAGITSSFYAPFGTLEAELIAESNSGWESLCIKLDVPYNRIGALTVALDKKGIQGLDELEAQVRKAGTKVERISGDQAREQEPLLTEACVGALYYPDEGIIDPMRLTWAFAELAVCNSAKYFFGAPVTSFARDATGALTQAHTPRGTVSGRYFINASGLGSGEISRLADGDEIKMWPRKGQYWILDREFGQTIRRIVLPVPGAESRGIEIAPTTNGSALLGPDAEDGKDFADTETVAANLQEILEKTRRLIPTVSLEMVIKSYAANRPAASEPVRLRIDSRVSNLVHVGNRSTGVSTSPAFAERVADLLNHHGLDTSRRLNAIDELPPRRKLSLDPNPEQLDADPRYSQVVCVCEQVTAAEIAGALTCGVPARSIEGVRKRTRATGGRCQGSVCMAGVILMCAAHGDVPPGQVLMGSAGGTVGIEP